MLNERTKAKLIEVVGSANFQDSSEARLVYSYDATPNFQSLPDAVIMPENKRSSEKDFNDMQRRSCSYCAKRFRAQI